MYSINPDIKGAETLPSEFYIHPKLFEQSKETIFAKSWHYVGHTYEFQVPKFVKPINLLPGFLNEPIILVHDAQKNLHCLSNVCTHRGKIIIEKEGTYQALTCGYHGRCFHLDGTFKSMPAFQGTLGFPRPEDHLSKLALQKWGGLLFTNLQDGISFDTWIEPIQSRVGWLPLDTLEFDAAHSKNFTVHAHWALYCDNYLEGFHVPFVHPGLNAALDFANYSYELFPYGNLQLGIAKDGQPCFDIPESSPDYGRRIYAYYFWLFPNIMLNFYPWGLSMNIAEPIHPEKTLVRFLSFNFKNSAYQRADFGIDATEYEDEAVVESVQSGIKSRFYNTGRFSPSMELGVHQFHSLLSKMLHPIT